MPVCTLPLARVFLTATLYLFSIFPRPHIYTYARAKLVGIRTIRVHVKPSVRIGHFRRAALVSIRGTDTVRTATFKGTPQACFAVGQRQSRNHGFSIRRAVRNYFDDVSANDEHYKTDKNYVVVLT